jgi:AcrR family transcriptional regulator
MAQQERAKRTHEAVLDAAAEEFAARGYTNTNLSQVAARTGMTKGALYGHFISKEALAGALVRHLEQVWGQIAKQIEGAAESPVQVLRNVTCELVARLDRDIRVNAALRLVLESSRTEGRPDLLVDVERLLFRLVVAAQRVDELNPRYPPEVVAEVLVTVIFGTHYLGAVCEERDLVRRIRAALDILLPALGAPPGGLTA